MTTFDQLLKTEISTESDNYDDYDNYDDFPDAYTIFLEIKSTDKRLNQGEKGDFDERIEAKNSRNNRNI